MYARTRDAPWVLYDLEADPFELNNLAEDPASADLREDLDGRLAGLMDRHGDSWDHDWTAPIEDGGRLFRHETFYTVEDFMTWARDNPELANLD